MPKLIDRMPRYCKHRASGQAVVTIDGRTFYLGPHGTATSKREYDRIVAEWLGNGRRLVADEPDRRKAITVEEVVAQYWKHAKAYYGDTGKRRGTANKIKPLLTLLRKLYGHTPAAEFGPKRLKAVRQKLISDGQSRTFVNANVGQVKRIFRWAASDELIDVSVSAQLDTVEGLRSGRTTARETAPILPIDDATVEATIPYLNKVVADMVRMQQLTGARPGEVCILRPADIDRSGDVWLYRPFRHKTQHKGKSRCIFIGPKAQEVLTPYLLRPGENYCFSPRESEQRRRQLAHEARETPLSCGNRPGSKRTRNPQRPAGRCYTNDSYRRAIHRAIEKANEERDDWNKKHPDQKVARLEKWAPNRLRHSAATKVRKQFGLENAQVILGHSRADVTQVYAEVDQERGREVARQIG